MSIHRLSAGTGYQYLLRSVAVGDTTGSAGSGLSAYYAASGTPPGRWYGTGLPGLGDEIAGRVRSGEVVTEAHLAALYGNGRDPVTDHPLGRGYHVYASVEQRIAHRTASLPADLDAAARAAEVAAIRAREEARPVPQPVAGFDLTFTATKSVSVLWALADPKTRALVETAHHAAVADTIAYLERTAGYTRTGKAGANQVRARGFVVAAFDHWDTRTGDPNLHTHAVVANRVQGPDGSWRSLDSQVLHHAAVAASELYDTLLADHLTARLPVGFAWRSRGERRSPAYELHGIDDDLLGAFSTRSHDIDTALRELHTGFRERTGREPTRPEVLQLRQQATLATRPDKAHRSLRELLASWQDRAEGATGQPAEMLAAAVTAQAWTTPAWRHDEIVDNALTTLTRDVLAGCLARRSTWTIANIHAEVARATRDLRLASTGDRLALLDRITTAVLAQSVPLFDPAFAHKVRPEGVRALRVQDRRWSHRDLLAAEYRLLVANNAPTASAPTTAEVTARDCATRTHHDRDGRAFRLASDQVAAVVGIATSQRHIDVLVGPAGTGKTTTLLALSDAWEISHGPGSVIGLASSATAAAQLGWALGISCETSAKWLHEASKTQPTRDWQLQPGQLVIVDEASLSGTLPLDHLRAQATAAGAKLLLVGDHHQLAAIDAGGAFGLLARHGTAHSLTSLWRFHSRWEAHATRALRGGDPTCLDNYAQHDRIHAGAAEVMHDAAYAAWQSDIAAGHSSLLVAADTATVTALNTRAHTDRVVAGQITGPTVPLGDISTGGPRGSVGVGDLVLTRRNDRTLAYLGGFVRNGQQWTVTALHPDGVLTIRPPGARDAGRDVRLPADYVQQHLDLGYAVTLHRAQGSTVDSAHLLARPSTGRRGLYVGMTRGRDANHLYLAIDQPSSCDHDATEQPASVRGVLTAMLADDRAEHSALETHAEAVGWAEAIAGATPSLDTRAGTVATSRGDDLAGRWDPTLEMIDPDAQQHATEWSLTR